MKFKIGDKVRVVNCINKSKYFEVGDIGEVVHIYEYADCFPISVLLDKNKENIDFSEEEIELYEGEKDMEKTFKEVIADIKEGEVYTNGKIEIAKTKYIIDINFKEEIIGYGFSNECKQFKLKRKEYTFEEAFKAYEENKEIESIESKIKYQKRRLPFENEVKDCCFDGKDWYEVIDGYIFSMKEIRGSWYINY